MRKLTLLFLVAFDQLWFEIKWAIKMDIRRLAYMLTPFRDAETEEKIYRVVPENYDHDSAQYCMFCDRIQPVCTVTTGESAQVTFCNKCGFELVAYDTETE